MNYTCNDCQLKIDGKILMATDTVEGVRKDVYLCEKCDTIRKDERQKEINKRVEKQIEDKKQEEKQKQNKRYAKIKQARATINSFPQLLHGVTHDRNMVDAMNTLRSAWNSDRTMFFVISGGGNMVRYYRSDYKNIPNFAWNK